MNYQHNTDRYLFHLVQEFQLSERKIISKLKI